MFRKIDCIRIKVPSLEKGINFYSNELKHEILWKTSTAIGLKLPNSNSEIVIHTELEDDLEVDFKVNDVVKASKDFVKAGGKILLKPFEIAIGKCCVVEGIFSVFSFQPALYLLLKTMSNR